VLLVDADSQESALRGSKTAEWDIPTIGPAHARREWLPHQAQEREVRQMSAVLEAGVVQQIPCQR
jgi:hypothetical protein